MTSSIQIIINETSREARRIDIFRESLAGIGRFEVQLENQDNIYGGEFAPQDPVELKINNTSMMKGYVDDILPNVKDPAAVYRNLMRVLGRDYGQDLVNLFHTKKYLDTEVVDIIADALYQPPIYESELGATWSENFPDISYEFKRQYLLDGFCDIAKLVDADFYVRDEDKLIKFFLLSAAPNSNVTLKSVAGAADNNILSIDEIGEQVGFDIRNYIQIEAGDTDDHWTEGNASDFTGSNCTVANETTPTLFVRGKTSVRSTRTNTGAGLTYLQFPKYNHDTIDLSEVAQTDCTAWVRYHPNGSGFSRYCRMYAKDDAGNEIINQDSWTGLDSDKWDKIDFKMGNEVDIVDSGSLGWIYLTGSTFSWNLTRLGVRHTPAAVGDIFWLDGLKLGGITATAIADEGTPWGGHRKRMIPITRTDIKSQLQLDALAVSELAYRKDPTQKLKTTAIFQPNCKYAGQTVVVNAPSSGINNVTYRILGLHHSAEPRQNLSREFDAITEFDLVKYGTTGVDPLRVKLSNNPIWVAAQRFGARLRSLEKA
jgi:hypothetical protein